jgi:hypothetical protein
MTAQIGENLHYRGESVTMATEPLESYFAMGGAHPGFEDNSTALHRGYVGSWEITGERLYLVEMTGAIEGGMPASLESIFPGFPDRVFAHWYCGTLRIPQGKRLRYVHGGYLSVYERDLMLEIEKGVVRRTWVRDNVTGTSDEPVRNFVCGA